MCESEIIGRLAYKTLTKLMLQNPAFFLGFSLHFEKQFYC